MDLVLSNVHSISCADMEAMWERVPDEEPSDIPPPDDEVAGSERESSSNDSNVKLEAGDCAVGFVKNPDMVLPFEVLGVYSGSLIEFENGGNFTDDDDDDDDDDERVSEEMSVRNRSGRMQLLPPSHILDIMPLMPNDCDESQAEVERLLCSNLEGAVESGESSRRKGAEDPDERCGEGASRCEDDVEGADRDVDDFRPRVFDVRSVKKRSAGVLEVDDPTGPVPFINCDLEGAANSAKKRRLEEEYGKLVEVIIIEENGEGLEVTFNYAPNMEYFGQPEDEVSEEPEEKCEENAEENPEEGELKVELAMLDMVMQGMMENFYFDENKDKHLENGDGDENQRRGL